MLISPLRDLTPKGDVKGGSPKTPPRGIPLSAFRQAMTKGEEACVTLKDYIDTRFKNVEDGIQLARQELETRLHSLNEWKQQTLSDRNLYATRESHDHLQEQVNSLSKQLSSMDTTNAAWMKVLGAFLILVQIVSPIVLYVLLHK